MSDNVTAPELDSKPMRSEGVGDRDDLDGKSDSRPRNKQGSRSTSPDDFKRGRSRDGKRKRKRQPSASPEPYGSPAPEADTPPSTPRSRSKRPRTSAPTSDALPYGPWPPASDLPTGSDSPSGNIGSTSSVGVPCAAHDHLPTSADETLHGPPTPADPSLGTDNVLPPLNSIGNSASSYSHPLSKASPSTGSPPSKARPAFNFWEALFREEDLTRYVATWMDVADVLKLYCISKRFHWVFNKKYTSTIMASARIHAPIAMYIFPYQAYRRLCIRDPMRLPMPRRPTEMRMVPSLKWLQMIVYRTFVVHDILLALSMEGIRFPKIITRVLMKIWFLLDIPYTGVRIGIIHNPRYWTSSDLWYATMFFVKLDLRFTDPVGGSGSFYLRCLMMGQRGLTVLWLALRGKVLTSRLELLQMMVKFDYEPRDGNPERLPIMGIEPSKVGGLSCEAWTAGNMRLLRPDELVLKEATRRRMGMHRYFSTMLLWGFVDWNTLETVPVPDLATLTL